jgi:Na+-translocating ferredoxin:NAD+ oxidoreductase subunit G
MNSRIPFGKALRCALLAVLLLGGSRLAHAQTFYTPRAVLARLFPSSQRVTYRRFELTPEVRGKLTQQLGAPPAKDAYTFYYALTGETVDGYALIDEVMGQYMPITYAVKFSPKGVVQQVEIMVYRENYGSEVGDARFRKQFVGKTAADPLLIDSDIVAVSGATLSCRALTAGLRRSLLLLQELLRRDKLGS